MTTQQGKREWPVGSPGAYKLDDPDHIGLMGMAGILMGVEGGADALKLIVTRITPQAHGFPARQGVVAQRLFLRDQIHGRESKPQASNRLG